MTDIIGGWLVAFFTLAILSFLYKDNPIYKLAEHIFVGVGAGYGLVLIVTQTLKPNFWDEIAPLFTSAPGGHWERLGAGILGLMFLMRLTKKYMWVSTWPLGMMVGTFAALRMTGLASSDLVGQLHGTMLTLHPAKIPFFDWTEPSFINHFLIIAGVVSVLIYFFFSLEHRGILNLAGKSGIYFLMITFGASYGYTVMARVSLLIGRVTDLYTYSTAKYGYATLLCALFISAFLLLFTPGQRTAKDS